MDADERLVRIGHALSDLLDAYKRSLAASTPSVSSVTPLETYEAAWGEGEAGVRDEEEASLFAACPKWEEAA